MDNIIIIMILSPTPVRGDFLWTESFEYKQSEIHPV